MADEFLKLEPEERREVINAAAPELGILPAVAEEDVWVCFVLNVLFSIPDPAIFAAGCCKIRRGLQVRFLRVFSPGVQSL